MAPSNLVYFMLLTFVFGFVASKSSPHSPAPSIAPRHSGHHPPAHAPSPLKTPPVASPSPMKTPPVAAPSPQTDRSPAPAPAENAALPIIFSSYWSVAVVLFVIVLIM